MILEKQIGSWDDQQIMEETHRSVESQSPDQEECYRKVCMEVYAIYFEIEWLRQ
jgi:hypothetical protein